MLIIQTPDLDSFTITFIFSICNVADTSREGGIRKEKNDQTLSILDLFLVTVIYFVLKE